MTYPMGAVTLKTRATPAVNAQRKSLAPPAWVATLLEGAAAQKASAVGPIRLQLHSGSYFTLVSARVPDVSTPARLESGTRNAYLAIRDVLSSLEPRHPVRFWNHISDITAATAIQGKNRYMAFNAGRFQAMTDWFGGIDHFDTAVPTASGIGHGGRGLIVHCLAARRPGRAISNPRQVQPHRYSARFGPLPPCFARATILAAETGVLPRPLLLVGGTASVCGEESVHLANLQRQFAETLVNLRSLLAEAKSTLSSRNGNGSRADLLDRFRYLRVYYPRLAHTRTVRTLTRRAFTGVDDPEIFRAELCRAELLVEIEGVAVL